MRKAVRHRSYCFIHGFQGLNGILGNIPGKAVQERFGLIVDNFPGLPVKASNIEVEALNMQVEALNIDVEALNIEVEPFVFPSISKTGPGAGCRHLPLPSNLPELLVEHGAGVNVRGTGFLCKTPTVTIFSAEISLQAFRYAWYHLTIFIGIRFQQIS